MSKKPKSHFFTGLLLIGLGIIIIILQKLGANERDFIFFLGGSLFLVGYFHSKSYGLLIPGCLLIGVGLSTLSIKGAIDISGAIGLGIGFMAIYIIDLIYMKKTQWWPLLPGFILITVGILQNYPSIRNQISRGWPILIIIIGIFYIIRSIKFSKKR